METTISFFIILLYSILVLAPTIAMFYFLCSFIPNIFDRNNPLGNKILNYVLLILLVGLCAICSYGSISIIYTVTNKVYGNPKPSNQIELYEDGEVIIQYQDTIHFCNTNDENSHCFTARIPANKKAYRDDICIRCGQPFTDHYTHKEKHFFDAMSSITWEWSISY